MERPTDHAQIIACLSYCARDAGCDSVAALTIATMPARIASGSSGHAVRTTPTGSRSVSASVANRSKQAANSGCLPFKSAKQNAKTFSGFSLTWLFSTACAVVDRGSNPLGGEFGRRRAVHRSRRRPHHRPLADEQHPHHERHARDGHRIVQARVHVAGFGHDGGRDERYQAAEHSVADVIRKRH